MAYQPQERTMHLLSFAEKRGELTEKEIESPELIPAKELIKKPIEEPFEEPVEESTEEPVEESTEEPTEELIEDPAEEPTEEPAEEPIENTIKHLVTKYRKFLICAMLLLFTLLVIYLGMAQYFKNHFYFGTEINGINVSGKTLEDVKEVMAAELKAYRLNIKERGGKIEQIKAHEVGLKFTSGEEFKKIKDSQKGLKWISAFFAGENSKKTAVLTYDEKLLKERINQLSCFKPGNIVEPKNPSFKYVDNSYVIVNEVIGNKVNKQILYSHAAYSISKMEAEIDLELMGCYIKPKYDSNSPKVLKARDTLNKYVATKISYTSGDSKKTLDGSQINQWLNIDENLKVTVSEEKVKEYINELSNIFNTVGKTRNFVTSSGEIIKISGGDYGRSINKAKETQYLISAIKEGKTITKEPIYSQNTFSYGNNDIENTYVEISLAKQHLWFYKNGSLIVHGDVVTGNVRQNHSTRKGIYSLKYKARDAILRGPDYAVHVDFWMPFDGGIGIHDASWRSVFGKNIYKTNGSHGCVNSPYNVAKKIFDNITPGTPVICY